MTGAETASYISAWYSAPYTYLSSFSLDDDAAAAAAFGSPGTTFAMRSQTATAEREQFTPGL